jgi:ParB family chromosome partitioning protein
MQTVQLSELSIADINVRKTRAGAEPLYAASIRAKGVIEPLIVRKNGSGYTITNGGKRYAALMFLRDNNQTAKGERVTDNYPVGILVREESDAEARDTSLTTNLVRSDMHPVDLHQAFVDLINDGKSEADIAAEYLMTDREVKQVLALGALSPKVLEAWKEEKIDAELARAFTLGQSHTIQDKALTDILERIENDDEPDADDVKDCFKLPHRDIGAMVEFVGVEECEKRKVKVKADLFGIDHSVSNEKLVKEMSIDKLDAECDRLVKEEGWGWAKRKDSVKEIYKFTSLRAKEVTPEEDEKIEVAKLKAKTGSGPFRRYGNSIPEQRAFDEMQLLEAGIQARGYSAEQKAKAGCFVSITDTGVLEVEYGKVKPSDTKAAEAIERAAAKPKKKKASEKTADKKPNLEISNNLIAKLAEQLTKAAAEAITTNPVVALPAIISGFLCSSDSSPVDVDGGRGRAKFAETFEAAMKKKPAEQLQALAQCAGPLVSITVRRLGYSPLKEPGTLAFCEALGAPLYTALKKHFDAKEYFSSVNGHICRRNLRDMFGRGYQEKWETEKKGALEKIAVTKARETGWLPPELRTSFYTGPSAKPEDVKPPKAKPAQQAKSAVKKKAAKKPAAKKTHKPQQAVKPWSPFGSH